jgi:hypothetical protein
MELAREIVLAALFFLIAAVLTSGRGLAQDRPRHVAADKPQKQAWLRKSAPARRCSFERIGDGAEVKVCRVAVRL